MLKSIRSRFFSLMAVAAAALCLGGAPQKAEAQGAEPFLGQLVMVGFNFCPRGWAAADGQLLPISSNSALFSLLGTIYGGDGRTTFALPDLRGRVPIHTGTGPGLSTYREGNRGGSETHVLSINEMPSHSHIVNATNAQANKFGPGGDYLADPKNNQDPNSPDDVQIYHDGPPNRTMDPGMIAHTGGSQAFGLRQPYLTMRWCIATVGIFPSRS